MIKDRQLATTNITPIKTKREKHKAQAKEM